MRGVLAQVAEKSGWANRPRLKGSGMGVAFHYSHRGHFAEVVRASVSRQGVVKVEQVWWLETSAAKSSTRAMRRIKCRARCWTDRGGAGAGDHDREGQGGAEQLYDFPLLRLTQAPPVEVHFVKTPFPPTGLGEPALPPVIPALCNAIFEATGKRIRSLPIKRHDLTW